MGWQAALIKVSVVPSPEATDLERHVQTMSKSCNCPMHNSMVRICGMLELTGLLLTIAAIRAYQCHTNKNCSSANPTLLPPTLTNCMTVPDIPHCSKRPVCIFHTWTILLSLKRKQKLFCSRNEQNEINELNKTVCWITFCTVFCISQWELYFIQTIAATDWTTLLNSRHYFYLFRLSKASFSKQLSLCKSTLLSW